MSGPTPRIPSPENLLPLPAAACRLAYLLRNWFPGAPSDAWAGLATAVESAHRVADLIGRARAEMGAYPGPLRIAGWPNALLVKAGLDRLAVALQALLECLGWQGLWNNHRWSIVSEGVTAGDDAPVEPAEGVALIVEPPSPRHVPTKFLDALEHAAGLLHQELLVEESPSMPAGNNDALQVGNRDDRFDLEQHIDCLAKAIGDDNTAKVLAIVNRKDWSGERKMEAILRLNDRARIGDGVVIPLCGIRCQP
jgi:hypothetical protein